MARNKRASFTWSRRVASTEGSPIVVADIETFNARAGNVEGAAEDVDIDEGAVLLDTNGGGPADVGVSDDEVIVLLASSDFDDEPKSLAKLVKAIEGDRYWSNEDYDPCNRMDTRQSASGTSPVGWKSMRLH